MALVISKGFCWPSTFLLLSSTIVLLKIIHDTALAPQILGNVNIQWGMAVHTWPYLAF